MKNAFLSLVHDAVCVAALFPAVSASPWRNGAELHHAVLLDANYNEVLCRRVPMRRPIRQHHKVMTTALLVLEAIPGGKFARIPPSRPPPRPPRSPEELHRQYQGGKVLTVEQLLYLLLLPANRQPRSWRRRRWTGIRRPLWST